MCFSVGALYSAPASLCSCQPLFSKAALGKDSKKPRHTHTKETHRGKHSDLFSPGVIVSIDSDICFKHRIQHGRPGGELSHEIALFLLLESLPTVGGQVLWVSEQTSPSSEDGAVPA